MAGLDSVVPPVIQYVGSSVLAVSGVTLLLYFMYHIFLEAAKNYPPGPVGIPILGNVLSLLFSKLPQHEVMNDWSHKYGPIFVFRMLSTRVYVLSEPGLVSEAFHQSADINGRMSMAAADEISGRPNNGLVASVGESWKEQRRFFMAFIKKLSSDVISLEEIIGSQAEKFLTEVETKHGDGFDPWNQINVAVANIITKVITGVTYEYEDRDFRHMIECSARLFHIVGPAQLFAFIPILSKIPSPIKTEAKQLASDINAVIRKSIAIHRAEFDREGLTKDFISCYLKEMQQRKEMNNPGSFDDINLLATCSDALLGGWEPTTSSIAWFTFTLAAHPEAQRRVRQEIFDVVGCDRFPRFSDRHSMPITEATLAECTRLHPVAAFHVPHIATRDCKLGGYDVTKGSAVTTNLWYLALSPNLWEDPQDFRPERFLDIEGQFNKKLEPLPFGYGRRVCPGELLARMEIFLFVTYLLQRFSLTLPEGSPTTNIGKHGLTNKPDSFKIHAKKIY